MLMYKAKKKNFLNFFMSFEMHKQQVRFLWIHE